MGCETTVNVAFDEKCAPFCDERLSTNAAVKNAALRLIYDAICAHS